MQLSPALAHREAAHPLAGMKWLHAHARALISGHSHTDCSWQGVCAEPVLAEHFCEGAVMVLEEWGL